MQSQEPCGSHVAAAATALSALDRALLGCQGTANTLAALGTSRASRGASRALQPQAIPAGLPGVCSLGPAFLNSEGFAAVHSSISRKP